MNELTDRLARLSEYKERTKHMRGLHDQRSHNRYPPGYQSQAQRGGSGRPTRGGGGAAVLGNADVVSGVLADAYQIDGTTGVTSGRYVGARPERQAAFGLQAARVQRAAARRSEAERQGKEYIRRHRMTNFTAPTQGVVSPLAMKPIAYGNFFRTNDQNANLFQNPTRIEGNDPANTGKKTNMWSYMTGQISAIQTDVAAYLRDEQNMPADVAQAYALKVGKALTKRYEAYMRKGAASFAMDIQGFVGGKIYSNDDEEMTAARGMAVEANKIMASSKNAIGAILDEAADKAGVSAFADDAVLDGIINQHDRALTDWTTANEPKAMAPAAIPGISATVAFPAASARTVPGTSAQGTVINPRQLSRINPALAEDMIARTLEESGGVNTSASLARQSTSSGIDATFGSSPTSVDNVTLSTDNMYALLSPEIKKQLSRIIKEPLKYPQSENPSTAFEDTQSLPLSTESATALTAFKDILDQLHTDGGIADVQVGEHQLPPNTKGMYVNESHEKYGVADKSRPAILLNPAAVSAISNSPTMRVGERISTLAHEFGHLIDISALTYGDANWRDFVSMTDSIGVSAGVSNPDLMSKSPMVAPILRIIDRFQNTLAKDMQSVYDMASPKDQPYIKQMMDYLSQPKEIFARLYQQWVTREMIDRIDAGKSFGGVKDQDGLQAELQATITNPMSTELPRFFRGQDYHEAVKDLRELFAIMGWKIK